LLRTTTLFATLALAAACGTASREMAASAAAPMTEEAMMKRMQELGTPGAAHKLLDPTVGTFNVTVHMWNAPGAPEQVSHGTEVSEWIWDGRFVKSKFEGDMGGQPFQGGGITGFDNSSGKYQGFWVDSMGTMMMPIATGTADASGKVLTFSRNYVDPMSGTPMTTREVVTIADKDHHTFEWYQPGPDGKEYKMMRIEYVRAK